MIAKVAGSVRIHAVAIRHSTGRCTPASEIVAATLHALAEPGMKRKELIAAVRERHPKESKEDSCRLPSTPLGTWRRAMWSGRIGFRTVGMVCLWQGWISTVPRDVLVTLPFRSVPDTVGEVSVAGLWSVEKVSSPEAAHVAPFATSAACP